MVEDLHAVLTARIAELERIARSAGQVMTTATWTVAGGGAGAYYVFDGGGLEVAEMQDEFDASHIAAWDPATVLRGLAEDRDILRRHSATYLDEPDMVVCDQCGWDVGDLPGEPAAERGGYQPCPDVASLARRHGVTP